MRVLIAIAGALLVALMVSEFFVTFMLPRRVRRDPRIARGLDRLLWRSWRVLARRLQSTRADTFLGFFGPLALLIQLVVWALGSMIGYCLIEWAIAGGPFSTRLLTSTGLFFGESSSGAVGVRVVELLEVATGIGVLFIVIGYTPAVYSAFSARETAVSQLAARAGSPPTAAALLRRASARRDWQHLARDFEAWEAWVAELMEMHLTYPLLAFYRSQHTNQNWLAALTTMVDTAAFLKACVHDEDGDLADITFTIGCQALADLAVMFRAEPVRVDRLSDTDFANMFAIIDGSPIANVDQDTARQRLAQYRQDYEPNAQALAESLVLSLPPWSRSVESCEASSSESPPRSMHTTEKEATMEAVETTWEPHTKHGRLTKQSDLPDSVFAFPTYRKEPLTDASHVRNAVARFDQVENVSDADRALAWANIVKAAQYYGVELSETDWHQLVASETDAQ
jgi:hypothetical protein